MTHIKRSTIMQTAITFASFIKNTKTGSGNYNLALIDGMPVSVEVDVNHEKEDFVVRGYLTGKLVYAEIGYIGKRRVENKFKSVDEVFAEILNRMWFDAFQESDNYTEVSRALRLDKECYSITLPAKMSLSVTAKELICRAQDGSTVYQEPRTLSKDLTQLVPLRESIVRYMASNNFPKLSF